MKKSLALILTLTLLFGLIAIYPAASIAEGEPYTLYFLHQASKDAARTKIIEQIIEDFQKEVDPNMKYVGEYIPDTEAYYSKLKTLIASNEIPSMFFGDPDSFTMGLRDQGLLYNVGEALKEMNLTDWFYDVALSYPQYLDGTQYSMCLQTSIEYFWYHPSIFKAAGIEETPKTWDEFLDVCAKLKDYGTIPVAVPGDTWVGLRWAGFIPYRMSGNGFLMDVISGKTSWYREESIAMADFYKKVTPYWPEGWASLDSSSARDLFLSGQAAMWYYHSGSALPYMTDGNGNLKEDIEFFKAPILEGYDATTPNDGYAHAGKGIYISKAYMSDNEDVKRSFIEYFVKHFGDLAVEYSYMPGIKPQNEEAIPPLYKRIQEDFGAVSSENYARCWDVVIDSVSNETLKAENINLLLGEITIEEFCKIMDDTIAENVKK